MKAFCRNLILVTVVVVMAATPLFGGGKTIKAAEFEKHIYISLSTQTLRYYEGNRLIDYFLVSTGIPGLDTPAGEFTVLRKVPTVLYQGADYYYPNTKWNLMFKNGYYIHGAYWHNNFGKKMSHGCVNVSYSNMESLYAWAEVGIPVTVYSGNFPSNMPFNYPSNTLLLDGKTIYLVIDDKKYGFPTMEAFTSLGYSFRNVKRGDAGVLAEGYVLGSSMPHPAGSWVISGQTVYLVGELGLRPMSTWQEFILNGGKAAYIVKANKADLEKL